VLTAIAAVMLVLALLRSVLSYAYSIAVAVLVERYIVVELRARVYEKLQRLSFPVLRRERDGVDHQPRDR
jgi:ATP-binding cassette, subfamily B, bacterial